jgi:hypothetical protein
VDHSLIEYDDFAKDFYTEHPSIAALTDQQVGWLGQWWLGQSVCVLTPQTTVLGARCTPAYDGMLPVCYLHVCHMQPTCMTPSKLNPQAGSYIPLAGTYPLLQGGDNLDAFW